MKYLFFTILLAALVSPSHATENNAEKYRKCTGLVATDPTAAVRYADDWIFSGSGGIPAGHCKAMGLLARGQAKEAATLLEKLGEDMVIDGSTDPKQARRNAGLRIEIYIQTALAWKQAGDYDKSYIAYSSAISALSPHHPLYYDLYLARGTLQILRRQYQSAINDFTTAISKNPKRFDAFLQRAKAFRKKHDYAGARLDLRIARKLAPDEMDILLESGILYRQSGYRQQARREWLKIIKLYPDSDFARLARTNIDLLNARQAETP